MHKAEHLCHGLLQLEEIKDEAQRTIEALLTDVQSGLGRARSTPQGGINVAEMRPRLERAILQLQSGLIERDTEVITLPSNLLQVALQIKSLRYLHDCHMLVDAMSLFNVSQILQDRLQEQTR